MSETAKVVISAREGKFCTVQTGNPSKQSVSSDKRFDVKVTCENRLCLRVPRKAADSFQRATQGAPCSSRQGDENPVSTKEFPHKDQRRKCISTRKKGDFYQFSFFLRQKKTNFSMSELKTTPLLESEIWGRQIFEAQRSYACYALQR